MRQAIENLNCQVFAPQDKPEPLSPGFLPLMVTWRKHGKLELNGFCFLGSEPKFVRLNMGLRTLPKQLTGYRQTARKAAVTVLRGNGGTIPSQPDKSGLVTVGSEPGDGAI